MKTMPGKEICEPEQRIAKNVGIDDVKTTKFTT
jgi:hypothetical protein